MKINIESLAIGFLLLTTAPVIAHPQPITDIQLVSESSQRIERAANAFADVSDLWKRKGGGGGGGKGGSGSSGSSGKGGSSSGSSSSGSSSSGYVTSNGGVLPSERVEAGERTESVREERVKLRRRSTPSPRSGRSEEDLAQMREDSPSSLHRRFDFLFFASIGYGSYGSGYHSNSHSSSSSSSGKGSSTSSTGGSTKQGSGVQPSYSGGRYYGGGATTPYRSGIASPLGIAPFLIAGGALALYPGIWAYGAYGYNYHNPYTFRNQSANATNTNSTSDSKRSILTILVERQDTTGVNETKPVTCLCAQYQECGCDDNGNTTFLDSLIGTGDYAALNKTLVNVADINGTSTIVLNGTLPNGTTTSGGTEDANGAQRMLEASGYWVMIALVGCTVLLV